MNLRTHVSITPAVHAHLSIDDAPELDRVIELPSGAPADWLIEAYLMSVGIERDRSGPDLDGHVRTVSCGWWDECDQRIRIPEIPHEIDVVIRSSHTPAVGDARVSVVETESVPHRRAVGDWQTAPPPFCAAHVNGELAQRFGVVLPHFSSFDVADAHQGISSHSRLARLLSALPPVRRLALRAHLDATVLEDRPRELAVVEAATLPIATLIGWLGPTGIAQDTESGWVAEEDIATLARELRWTDAGSELVPAPGEALIAFARHARMIRRLKGRVIPTNLGRSLAEPGARTLRTLADAVTAESHRYTSWSAPVRSFDRTLALLAIADGSAATVDDLPALVQRGHEAMGESPGPVYADDEGYPYDAFDRIWTSSFEESPPDPDAGLSPEVLQLLGRLVVVSEAGRFGEISPAMRAVAREALL